MRTQFVSIHPYVISKHPLKILFSAYVIRAAVTFLVIIIFFEQIR